VALTRDPHQLPPGLMQTSNIFTDTAVRKLTLKINLLGPVNWISVGKLSEVTTVERNANVDITLITDSSSESRLKALLTGFHRLYIVLTPLPTSQYSEDLPPLLPTPAWSTANEQTRSGSQAATHSPPINARAQFGF
jgi:hypothetical protein